MITRIFGGKLDLLDSLSNKKSEFQKGQELYCAEVELNHCSLTSAKSNALFPMLPIVSHTATLTVVSIMITFT